MLTVSARGLDHVSLNRRLAEAALAGEREVRVTEVLGQRYIGTGLGGEISLTLEGTPGEDLGAFMDGPTIRVLGNAQNAVGNTMNSGLIAIHGSAGDILGHSLRGGRIWVRGDVGYRVGIHMKAQPGNGPAIVVGGAAGDFLGEYMAGGVLIVLGLTDQGRHRPVGNWLGTGMHGGTIYVRGSVPEHRLGRGAGRGEVTDEDRRELHGHLKPYCREFSLELDSLVSGQYTKLVPLTYRPYGRLYVSTVGEC